MSVFSPIDVQAPDQRRKQLLQRLFQQAQQSRAASGAMASTSGPNFRSALNTRPGVFSMTQPGNIMADVLARLGVVGHDFQGDVSPGKGHAIGPEHGTPGPVSPVGPPIPVPGGGAAPPAASMTPTPLDTTFGQSRPGIPTPSLSHAQEGLVDLGGGMYYNQYLNRVVGSPGGLGSAAINLGGAAPYSGGGFGRQLP